MSFERRELGNPNTTPSSDGTVENRPRSAKSGILAPLRPRGPMTVWSADYNTDDHAICNLAVGLIGKTEPRHQGG
jgi:hypothetical protein